MAKRSDWLETLSEAEVAEVRAAAQALADSQAETAAHIATLKVADFPLPALAPRLTHAPCHPCLSSATAVSCPVREAVCRSATVACWRPWMCRAV